MKGQEREEEAIDRWTADGWRPTVWAPTADTVELCASGARTPMSRAEEGWWTSDDPLPQGSDYAFSLDGGDPRPDPRSAWQPDGVHAASRVFDARRHDWRSDDWEGRDVRGAVIVEVHIGTFTPEGTLDAAIDRLDHLVELGADMVELMPVAASP